MAVLSLTRAFAPLSAAFALAVDRRALWNAVLEGADPYRLARQSFYAIALSLPLLVMTDLASGLPTRSLGRDLLGNVVAWLGFAAFAQLMLQRAGRAAAWPRMILVWNWCNVVQLVMQLFTSLPVLLHAPHWVQNWVLMVFLGWALWLDYHAIRLGLGGPALPAAGLVFADLAIGILCQGFAG